MIPAALPRSAAPQPTLPVCRLLDQAIGRFEQWILQAALPHWLATGCDGEFGFVEVLDPSGRDACALQKRTMVQARQIAVFAQASRWGITGAADAARRGLAFLVAHAWTPESGWIAALDRHGNPRDTAVRLYDQAFVLYALSFAGTLGEASLARKLAILTLDRIDASLRSGGTPGWRTRAGEPARDQNGHMHYLEALLSLQEQEALAGTTSRIAEIGQLLSNCLLDPASGAVLEYFDDGWQPDLARGAPVEPGHQFEWAFLAARSRELSSRPLPVLAGALAFAERHGWSQRTGLLVDGCDRDGNVLAPGHRLWPHCEAIKALSLFADTFPAQQRLARLIERTMEAFLLPARPGLWCDRLTPEGDPVPGNVPASSLYHLWEAFAALRRRFPASKWEKAAC